MGLAGDRLWKERMPAPTPILVTRGPSYCRKPRGGFQFKSQEMSPDCHFLAYLDKTWGLVCVCVCMKGVGFWGAGRKVSGVDANIESSV